MQSGYSVYIEYSLFNFVKGHTTCVFCIGMTCCSR